MNALVAQTPPVRPILFNQYQRNSLANNQQYIRWREGVGSNVLIIHGQSPRPWVSGFLFEEMVLHSRDERIWTYFSFDESRHGLGLGAPL